VAGRIVPKDNIDDCLPLYLGARKAFQQDCIAGRDRLWRLEPARKSIAPGQTPPRGR